VTVFLLRWAALAAVVLSETRQAAASIIAGMIPAPAATAAARAVPIYVVKKLPNPVFAPKIVSASKVCGKSGFGCKA
jgi:ABC-type sugar transport system substrate-binding protein